MTADPTAAGAAEATGAAGASRGARNFRLGVLNGALNGALYQAGEGFMDSNTVIPLFVDAGILGGRIARLPTGVDPDDFVRQPDHGPDAFRRLVGGARPMLDQFIQDAASDARKSS